MRRRGLRIAARINYNDGAAMPDFLDRAHDLPKLGLGISTEYGARRRDGALDPAALRRREPSYAGFLEVGVELAKGLDDDALAWAAAGLPTTYHFLDINLDEPEDFDDAWLAQMGEAVATLRPAWLCGDAGLWHFGARDRGHMLLLPPVLVDESVAPMAEGIRRLRDYTGLEVLPENPPGSAFVGELHLLEFFAKLAEAGDTGLVLDCAHLAMFQRSRGLPPLTAFDGFPWERVIELHIAGGREGQVDGLGWVEDDHGVDVLEDTWTITQAAIERAVNLRAVVVECERNPLDAVLPIFAAARERLPVAFTSAAATSPSTPAQARR